MFFVHVYLVIACIYKWVEEDKKVKMINAYEAEGKKYSTLALNAWDHTTDHTDDVEDLKCVKLCRERKTL